MSGAGLEVLLEGLIPEIAYSGEKGVPIDSLLNVVRRYHNSLGIEDAAPQGDAQGGGDLASSCSKAEMTSARWAWDWLRSRPQILINGNKRWNRLQLSEVLALPEAKFEEAAPSDAQPAAPPPKPASKSSQKKEHKTKKSLSVRPRIYPSEDLVWQTLTRHGVDYKRVPVLEWKCLLGIASVRGEGILQSDLRRLVDQDKRSLPKRTDSLAKKGYIAKRTIVVQKMKTSKLWLIDFAPPILETESGGLDLSVETLTKDLEPVAWHDRWTGNNIDMEAFGRTFVAIVKSWGVIRYSDLRYKMGVGGKPWQMKTLAKNSQRFVDMGVLKYTAATFPGSRKVFKDCLKFIRDPRSEEWERWLATGKKTSQYSDATRNREPKPNALALYGKDGPGIQENSSRHKGLRIFSGWTPEKPLAQNVFEVIQSAGPEGASNPEVSVATVGYGFRRYMASHLTKVAETQQPPHLKKFQIVSELVRTGKTSAYMFSAPEACRSKDKTAATQSQAAARGTAEANEQTNGAAAPHGSSPPTSAYAYGFGAIRPRAFPEKQRLSLSELSRMARKPGVMAKRRGRFSTRTENVLAEGAPNTGDAVDEDDEPRKAVRRGRPPKRRLEETEEQDEEMADGDTREISQPAVEPDATTTRTEPSSATPEVQPDAAAGTEAKVADDSVIQVIPDESREADLVPHKRIPTEAFRGVPGSLHPTPRRLGRPKPSVVMIFRSEKLKTREISNLSGPSESGPSEQSQSPIKIELGEVDTGEADTGEASTTADGGVILGEPATPQSISEEPDSVPVRSEPSRGRGRGRGGARGGGRGRGGRRAQALAAGGKPYVCETCGGAWKNDIGLKYHQTKALTPCNPNFDPASVLDRGRKRRKLSPVPATPPTAASDAGGDEVVSTRPRGTPRVPKAERPVEPPRPKVRQALRSLQTREQTFRGFAFDNFPEPAEYIRPVRTVRRPEPAGPQNGSVPRPAEETDGDKPNMGIGYLLNNNNVPSNSNIALPHHDHMETDDHMPVNMEGTPLHGLTSTMASKPDEEHVHHQPEQHRYPSPNPSTSGNNTHAQEGEEHENERPHSSLWVEDDKRDEPYNEQILENRPTEPNDANGRMINPFKPSTDYDRMTTDAKRKTAQAMDIINYLLDENDGAFPGDKALFYALTKVFLKEFRNQPPPTWKNFYSAVRTLEVRKQALLHTHMLRTERGKMVSIYLLVRAGIDQNDKAPTQLRRKLTEFYPKIYIPEAFSPTQEELAMLQELEGIPASPQKEIKPNRNGQKFRSRRKIDRVEVLHAPYYTQNANGNAHEPNPFWARASEQLLPQKETSLDDRKRSASEELNGKPPTKRQKKKAEETLDEQNEPQASHDPNFIPIDPELVAGGNQILPSADVIAENDDQVQEDTQTQQDGLQKDGPQKDDQKKTVQEKDGLEKPPKRIPLHSNGSFAMKRRRTRKTSSSDQPRKPRPHHPAYALDGSSFVNPGSPSVIEAIKAYGLLPSRPGKRNGPKVSSHPKKMGKLPTQLGRARNPGLASLPGYFFDYVVGQWKSAPDPRVVEFRFLKPNIFLEDENTKEGGDGQGRDSTLSSPESSSDSGAVESVTQTDSRVESPKEFTFVPSMTLDISSEGSYSLPIIERNDNASFTLKGLMPTRQSIFAQNIPSSAEEMIRGKKGREFDTEKWADQHWGKFFSIIHGCSKWELSPHGTSVLLGGSVVPDYMFINVSSSSSKATMRPIIARWSDDTQYGLDTLPYGELEDLCEDDEDSDIERTEPRPTKKRRITKNYKRRMGVGGRPTKFKLHGIKTGRELSAYPKNTDDFLRIPGDEAEELDWTSENTRLTAFIVVTTLLGGVDRVVDWGLMMRLFPDLTISQLRHSWCALKKDRQSTIVSLTDKFRRSFLKAYESGELLPIDFNNTLAYDWKYLIKWTAGLDGFERANLPASRKVLGDNYDLPGSKYENREWREAYYHVQRSVFNKFQDATSEALAFPADGMVKPTPDVDLDVAMSWTRSLSVTPTSAYTNEQLIKRRNSLYHGLSRVEISELIVRGVDQLQRDGVISKCTPKWSNGRKWRFNHRVPETLDKVAQEDRLAKAVAFKRELDEAFRAGQKKRVTYITNDGMIMALLNLQAHGRVRVETTGQPNVPMGHEPGNYETRKYTKKYLHFRLDIVPTELYVYDDAQEIVEMRKRVEAAHPPTRGHGGAIPAWCDVCEQVNYGRWLKYLSAVMVTLASRGSMRPDELVKTLKPTIMLFEAELIYGWAEKLGLLVPQMDGMAGAVTEWWWMAADAQKKRGEQVAVVVPTDKARKPLPSARRVIEVDGEEA
ncbi:hypothetical protein B0T17DRAFT_657059 [Bombardia bombarda]|uniref:Uncharacterized protein n=1 Tax=Bombardia bombarda TaxID=252184 RepID=A0AA39WII2_9PEZI|nr:hypothetical protein B0T17DRAFT_657059 [Bombardia bombarda]